ncbi:hypothetical protein [Rodentibacter sp. Ppn85]|uniref:hypothetical protein n=1 Tax=Rodentibacter sp. Ppn85 TaxID=1908525 RepID=UPI0009873CF8|nr:hypothetical protein [Rodentibacter sp. Ppn85]
MKSYLKALILFPLISQGLAIVLLWLWDRHVNPFKIYAMVTFIFITIPAFLISLITAKFRYIRYNIVAIVLCSALVGFFYPTILIFCFSDRLDIAFIPGLVFMCLITFFALLMLPSLLPKTKSS